MSAVKLGVMPPLVPALVTSRDFMCAWVALVEDCGVESVWAVEHALAVEDHAPNYPYTEDGRMGDAFTGLPILDPLELLTFVAARSDTLRLSTCVMIAPLHSAAILAKRIASVDILSGGRLQIGLGIGWQREEYEAVGAPFTNRGPRLEEMILAMRELWTHSPASFHGRYINFDRVHSHPQPAGHDVPILLGGNSDAVLDRVGRIGNGWLPFTIGPDEVASAAARIRTVAVGAGRDPEGIEITAWPGSLDPAAERDVDFVRRYVAAGATRVLLWPQVATPDELPLLRHQIESYQDQVIGKL
ncbi:LLM class F420-dependent oxidoreductase [Frankia gtarii]|uniref:LLM class F420-dependent oxidoreductase n=1 Tax=Frankia gtarii TaxID=2950102 RepID=UPI0021BEC77F|nr:LLM class F420-dependent oxidoreductase [Frankia gtarii]